MGVEGVVSSYLCDDGGSYHDPLHLLAQAEALKVYWHVETGGRKRRRRREQEGEAGEVTDVLQYLHTPAATLIYLHHHQIHTSQIPALI